MPKLAGSHGPQWLSLTCTLDPHSCAACPCPQAWEAVCRDRCAIFIPVHSCYIQRKSHNSRLGRPLVGGRSRTAVCARPAAAGLLCHWRDLHQLRCPRRGQSCSSGLHSKAWLGHQLHQLSATRHVAALWSHTCPNVISTCAAEDTIGRLFGCSLASKKVPPPAADMVLSNIVPRRQVMLRVRPQGQSFTSLARSAARTAALALTLPLWAHRSYMTVGRTAFLNPLGVGPRPLDWSPLLTEQAAELCSSRVRMLRMHRLPVYRSRMRSLVCRKCSDFDRTPRPGDEALATIA